ncbi:MAG: hypothetical protein PUP91_36275 [Rhizonema sp. PD37]|nr:hypothetical protein [Rhizonema sp. PD37]
MVTKTELSLWVKDVATTRKLGEIGRLALIIEEQAISHPLGWSWNTFLFLSPDY